MQNNGYNYRTLNTWKQRALEHLSAMIEKIIGVGFENPSHLIDRVSDMVSDLSNWDTPNTGLNFTSEFCVRSPLPKAAHELSEPPVSDRLPLRI